MRLPLPVTTLRAFAEPGSRWFATVIFLLFAGPTSLILLATSAGFPGAFMASFSFVLATGFTWFHYPHYGFRLVRHARAQQIPSMDRAVHSALLLLFVITVVIPAAELTLYARGNGLFFLAVLSCAAFAALLFLMLNRLVVAFLVLLVGIAKLAMDRFAISIPHFKANILVGMPPSVTLFLTAVALILGMVCAIRWRQMAAQEPGSGPFDRMDAIVGPESSTASDVPRALPGSRARSSQTFPGISTKDIGPDDPESAMRVLMGPPFARTTGRARLRGSGQILVSALFLSAISWGTLGYQLPLFVMAMIGGILVGSDFRFGLRRIFGRNGDGLEELALLPAWRSRTHTLRLLLLTIVRPMIWRLVTLCIGYACVAILFKMRIATYVALAGTAIGGGSMGIARAMEFVVDQRPHSISSKVYVVVMTGLIWLNFAAWSSNAQRDTSITTALEIGAAWLIVTAAMALIALRAYRQLAARPHPFLTD